MAIPIQLIMPHIDAMGQDSSGSTEYLNVDFHSGYWELRLLKNQERSCLSDRTLALYLQQMYCKEECILCNIFKLYFQKQ